MKILIKNLRRILFVQLIILWATLSITATNAGADQLDGVTCNDPNDAYYNPVMGKWNDGESTPNMASFLL